MPAAHAHIDRWVLLRPLKLHAGEISGLVPSGRPELELQCAIEHACVSTVRQFFSITKRRYDCYTCTQFYLFQLFRVCNTVHIHDTRRQVRPDRWLLQGVAISGITVCAVMPIDSGMAGSVHPCVCKLVWELASPVDQCCWSGWGQRFPVCVCLTLFTQST
jgi:hypothetical protein